MCSWRLRAPREGYPPRRRGLGGGVERDADGSVVRVQILRMLFSRSHTDVNTPRRKRFSTSCAKMKRGTSWWRWRRKDRPTTSPDATFSAANSDARAVPLVVARQVALTQSRDVPTSRAIVRHDQCVAFRGSPVVVSSTIRLRSASRSASLQPPWLPPRGRSLRIPASPVSA